ncbi:ubiquitin fusion degradation family protein [Cryptosporidium ubiquitum]|uniref:Ubiquitin fusion degradation family protein n=1 Tax=Cryptosporidium ubiquitum TaxID=857276 RepID=A0A1J4MCJ9_9CRYT|nr:ubiquitin fusion degradation family protein [Cryptosporidium ubiquitum]OII71942.1 ubiquitin fusion degradation family protein [Cryptosporidium ubiquitum]
MDDFSSSLSKLKKEQEKERKRILEKKQKEKKIQEKSKFEVEDYLSSIERAFIKQQKNIINEINLDKYNTNPNLNDGILQEENKYSWILKLNLKDDNKSKFPNNGETDQVILPADLLKILSNDESIYPLYFNIKCLNYIEKNDKQDKNIIETHCGVLDYSEESGFISLPKKVIRCLNINLHDFDPKKSGSTIWIQITYKNLPKGSFASFEILNSQDIFKMHHIESFLESYLRNNFLTLTIGDTLIINQPNYLSNNYCISIIKVKHLEPENSISLINTDISLDIIYKDNNDFNIDPIKDQTISEDLVINTNNSTKQLNIGDILNIDDGLDVIHFKVDIPFNLKKVFLNESNTQSTAKLSISVFSNYYYDIFVSFPPIFEASSHLYIFRSFPEDQISEINIDNSSFGNKNNNTTTNKTTNITNNLFISSLDFINYLKTLESNAYNQDNSTLLAIFPSILFITIQKYESNLLDSNILSKKTLSSSSSIQVKINYSKNNDDLDRYIPDSGYSICTNCKRKVPNVNLDLHYIQCEKIYKRCDKCDLVLKKIDLEKHTHCNKCFRFGLSLDQVDHHEKLYHQYTQCKLCNQDNIKPIQLRIHQTQECPKRIILCRYCNDFVQAGTNGHYVDYKDKYYYNLTSHESYCGSRTTNCHLCNKTVLIKELKSHIDLIHTK